MGNFFSTAGLGNDLLSSAVQVGGDMLTSWYNNKKAAEREAKAREENYKYGEMSADAADARTRALYNDLYSPQAQMQQLDEAGLSKSIFANSGLAGKSGVSGAQGTGASGISPNIFGVQAPNAKEMAEIGLIKAQINNINENTISTEIENGIRKLNASTFEKEWKLLNTTWYGNENGVLSWSDLAKSSKDYNEFQSKVHEMLKDIDTPEALYVKTENGQKTLRNIYENNKTFGNDIAVLANSEENAKLMLEITKLLNSKKFANESANAQIKQLKQVSQSAELTTEQKGAMNRVIDKMGHSTTSDILLVLLMMLGQYSHANLNFGVSQSSQIKKIMCLFPRLLKNPKYKKNKKNGGNIPDMQDIRVRFVPVACGNCIECRKAKAREWQVRLNEELKITKYPYFITLTFKANELKQLCKKYKLKESNAVAGKAVRLFLERIRKDYKKSIKHWLITELGQTSTERIHLHGIFFMEYPINNEWLNKYWKYGITDTGQYCNAQTINYIIKYVTKIDTTHKNFKPQIFCSKGLGNNYITEFAKQKHKYKGTDTKDYYTLPNGARVNLPIYYRNKLFSEEEREKLWCDKLDNDTRYIMGTEIKQASRNQKYLIKVIEKAQETNKKIGYGDHTAEWKKEDYNITLNMLKKGKN